jgi:hypothetical protein
MQEKTQNIIAVIIILFAVVMFGAMWISQHPTPKFKTGDAVQISDADYKILSNP